MNLSNFFNSLLVVILIQGEALHVQSFDCKKEIYISGYDQAYCAIYGLDKPRYHPPPQQKKPGPLLPDPKPDPQPDPPGPPSHDGYSTADQASQRAAVRMSKSTPLSEWTFMKTIVSLRHRLEDMSAKRKM
ncbi:hypothetical protein PGT21_005093 [Puccinia graminis f. sp. tritici]|uniref:Uncharacterized protein n=1 Tax=Puccinia graminis f. sp. tritici TaxID=56615 RepID=A0A5B0PHD3_PUCGR|nr:hypothetical protein PGT21_005093 [Puccinia graminis f. sp. tritici]